MILALARHHSPNPSATGAAGMRGLETRERCLRTGSGCRRGFTDTVAELVDANTGNHRNPEQFKYAASRKATRESASGVAGSIPAGVILSIIAWVERGALYLTS